MNEYDARYRRVLERAKAAERLVAAQRTEIARLTDALKNAGAVYLLDGWHWPLYQHKAPTVMLPTKRWIRARKRAADVLYTLIHEKSDNTSSEVLPDIDGQNLSS